MPRTLPWLVKPSKHEGQRRARLSSSPPPERKRAPSPQDLVDVDLNPTALEPAHDRRAKRQDREPSTSPPPALQTPDVECMRPGYAADDIYMMVEDEFHSIAQSFTKHIHHAEYVRLKRLAKSRGEGTLQAIARPTDQRTEQSRATQLKVAAGANSKKAHGGVKKIADFADESEDDAYMFDPQLAGLMGGSQKAEKDLTGMARGKAKTRAAAGFAASPERKRGLKVEETKIEKAVFADASDDTDDTDDLDCSPRKVRARRPLQADVPKRSVNPKDVIDTKHATEREPKKLGGFFERFAQTSGTRRASSAVIKPSREMPEIATAKPVATTTQSDFISEDSPPPRPKPTSLLSRSRLTKNKAQEEKERKEAIEVPTFFY